MLCPECSYENPEGMSNCGWCGARLDKKKSERKEKDQQVKEEHPEDKVRPVKKRQTKNRPSRNPPVIRPVLVGVIVLGFILVLAIFIFSRDNSDVDTPELEIVEVWYCRTTDGARMFERSHLIESFGEDFYEELMELGLEPCE